jgi:hypothetical protein
MGQHFPGDLRVSRFIGANETESSQLPQKKESTECQQ